MEINRYGISRDFIFHPGVTLKEMLENKHISQRELAIRTGVTPTFIALVISGNKNISPSFAVKLGYALGVPSSFFINLQANYEKELAWLEDLESITDEEVEILKTIKKSKLFALEDDDDKTSVIKLRDMLRVANLNMLKHTFPEGQFSSYADLRGVDNNLLGAWIVSGLAESQSISLEHRFDKDDIYTLLPDLQKIMFMPSSEIKPAVKALLEQYGITISFHHKNEAMPVKGYISKRCDGVFNIVMSDMGGDAIEFWYTLYHELGHIYHGELNRRNRHIDAEGHAKSFADFMLVDPETYVDFTMEEDFSIKAIKRLANFLKVPPFIIIGLMTEEGLISEDKYKNLRVKYDDWCD